MKLGSTLHSGSLSIYYTSNIETKMIVLGQRLPDTSIVIVQINQQNKRRLEDPKSSAASAGISIASLEVGSTTIVLLRVVAEVLIATCKVNIRKSWTGKVQGFKTISLRKLSENKNSNVTKI